MKVSGVIGTALFSFFLFSCTSESPEEIQQKIEKLIQASDFNTSIVELKDAVSKFPENQFLREKLGRVLFLKGDLAGAEKEFDKIGAESWYLMSLYHQGKYEDIVLYRNAHADSDNPLLLFLNTISSEKLSLKSNAKDKQLSPFYTKLYEFYGENTKANPLGELTDLAAIAPDEGLLNQEFIILRADILTNTRNYDEAINEIRSLYPNWAGVMRVAFREVDLLLRSERFDEVDTALKPWLKGNEVYPWVNFAKAFLEFNITNYDAALFHAQKAIQSKAESAELLWIAGESAYQLNNKETAFGLFQKAYKKEPNNLKIRSSLAKTQLDLGYFDDATSILKTSDFNDDNSLQFIGLSSSYLITQGQTEQAIDLLEAALSKKENDRTLLRQLASIKFSEGKETLGTTQALYDTDNTSVGAAMMLIQTYLEMQDFTSAEKIASDFKNTDVPTASLMQALISLKKSDNKKALNIASKLVEQEPSNIAALRVAMAAAYNLNQIDEAFYFSKQLVEQVPISDQGALDFIYLYTKKFPSDVDFMGLQNEVANVGDLTSVYKVVAKSLIANSSYNRAWQVLSDLNNNDAGVINLKVKTLLLLNRKEDAVELAISEFGELPDTVDGFLMLASVYEQLEKNEALLNLVANTPAKLAKDWRIIIGKLNVFKNEKDFKSAKKELAKLDNARFPVSLYKKFEGELALAAKNYSEARESFKSASQLQQDFGTTVLLAKSYFLDGQLKQAVAVLNEAANDGTAKQISELHSVAEFMSLAGNNEKAQVIYERIVAEKPNDHAALNNLANAQIKRGMYDEAIVNAKKAITLSNHNAYLDTLADAYFYRNDSERVVDTLQKLQKQVELNPEQALRLAEAYISTERYKDASNLKTKFYTVSNLETKKKWDAMKYDK
ncbi:hypothetical protein BM527_13125 [Alteromonas sp. Mex14]|nr:hypothetical protein BM527_13125 [Alteromonas sp. Mex14]